MATNPNANQYPYSALNISIATGDPDLYVILNDANKRANMLSDRLNGSGGVLWDLWGNVGDDDQTKLEAYTAYARQRQDAKLSVPTLIVGPREYTVSRTLTDLPRGWKMDGCGHGMNHQVSTSTDSFASRVKSVIPAAANGIGVWIDTSSGVTNWTGYVGNIGFYDNTRTTQWFRAFGGSAQWREWTWLNTTFQNSYSVWGRASEYTPMTFCSIRGDQTLFNTASTSWNIGGSDCVGGIFADGVDHYQPGDTISGQANGNQQWAGMFSSLGKSEIGPMYFTGFGGWRGYLFTGGEQVFGGNIRGGVWEGNNENQPCDGSLARFEGGTWNVWGTVFDDAMANPALTANKASNGAQVDRALVEVLGTRTNVEMWGPQFAHGGDKSAGGSSPYPALPLTTPVVWASKGAKVGVHGAMTGKRNANNQGGGSSWGTQLPVVGASTGADAPTWVQRDYSTANGAGVAPLTVSNGLA